jgi:uncharacterized membrane protein
MKFVNWLKENYLLGIILLVAAILRFYRIDYQSLWLDEIYSIKETNPDLPLKVMYDNLNVSEQAPPLYFLLAYFALKVFGYSAFVLRMFSACIGIAGVFMIYLLGKELQNKKAGAYAALLLSINYFHLSYSQEARMYTLLFLFTTLSFYMLVRFIKTPGFKSCLFYTISTIMMIYTHFFALFALLSQCVILLVFLIKPYNVTRRKFFLYCLISGLVMLVMYLPNYSTINKIAAIQRSSVWIPDPTADVYTQIFKDFFGQSEIVLLFVIILGMVFFSRLINEENDIKPELNPNENKNTFSFFILITWLFITLLVPLIRSHTSAPVTVSRYFMGIVPAVIMIISIGLYYIKNTTVRYGILTLIVIFSFTDIFVVKKYYTAITKSQFREVSNYIIEKNTDNQPVVSSMAFFYTYFLNNEKVKTTLVEKPMEEYVTGMMNDSTKIAPFWYADAHGRTLGLQQNVQKFVDENFVLSHEKVLYNAWTHHYSLISSEIKEENISRYEPLKDSNGDAFRCYIDKFETTPKIIKIKGWAYFSDQDATDSNIEIILVGNGKAYKIQSQKMDRNDVAEYHRIPYDLTNCGFRVNALTTNLPPGTYRLGIILKNKKTNKEGLVLCANSFVKN